jgi:hypothetical protein
MQTLQSSPDHVARNPTRQLRAKIATLWMALVKALPSPKAMLYFGLPVSARQINHFMGAKARFDWPRLARLCPQMRASPSGSRALSEASLDTFGVANDN